MAAFAALSSCASCSGKKAPAPPPKPAAAPPAPKRPPIPARQPVAALPAGQTYAYDKGVAKPMPIADAQAAGLLDINLADDWAPFILQDTGGRGEKPEDAKPNAYRETFVGLANDRLDEDGDPARPGNRNYLDVFGIPPSMSVLLARVEADMTDAREDCIDAVDRPGLEQWTDNVIYLDRDRAKREYDQALRDADWLEKEITTRTEAAASADGGGAAAPDREAVMAALRADPKTRGRVDRYPKGQARLRAVRAMQARLVCEGLLSPKSKFVSGMYDLQSHEALAVWERKNDVFGWGFLGGETLGMLLQPPRGLLLDAFKRTLAERVADAAGIIEDGSINLAMKKKPPMWKDSTGKLQPVPNLIDDHVNALLAAIGVSTPEEMVAFLRAHKDAFATLHVAIKAPPLPEYYQLAEGATEMNLSTEIDRGDIWYDLPFNEKGKPVVQKRDKYPHLTLFVRWRNQKIPLAWWRTTIGSWRSEMHADGQVYFKYKNSDIGPRVWKDIVAGPVWIPPDGTPAKDLLKTKVLDRKVGPVTVVNTGVMGPGYQSAYGMVMGIHIDPKRGGFDNQIRTHGSVDYTSIARRFSHGCHRLVNNRAVRLFDFVLRHKQFNRRGDIPLNLKKKFEVEGEEYKYQIKTRGYYYTLFTPLPVDVLEGRIKGEVKKPITAFVRKPGVEYVDETSGDAATSTAVPSGPGL
jgi:hypothetical protein